MVYNVKEIRAHSMSSFLSGGNNMRTIIYIITIANVIMGFVMLFRENDPFKGKTYRDIAEKARKDH